MNMVVCEALMDAFGKVPKKEMVTKVEKVLPSEIIYEIQQYGTLDWFVREQVADWVEENKVEISRWELD